MYLVSLVTVMCSPSFSLQYFATRQKDSFACLESMASIPIFVHGRDSALGADIAPSYLNRIIWGFTVVGISRWGPAQQCSRVIAKANGKLVVIRRSLKLCNPSVKESTYYSFVGPPP